MKKIIASAATFAILAGFLGTAWSQSPAGKKTAPQAVPHKVGLIDMGRVFKEYKKFEDIRDSLRQEVAASEQKARTMSQTIQDLQEKMKPFKPGSPEYSKLETEVARKSSELQAFGKVLQRDLLRKETQAYKDIYLEVSKVVRMYAEHYDYTLVMRFESDPIDSADPQKLLQSLNRQVVYHRTNDDITQNIVDYLNGEYAKQKGGAAAGRSQAPTSQN